MKSLNRFLLKPHITNVTNKRTVARQRPRNTVCIFANKPLNKNSPNQKSVVKNASMLNIYTPSEDPPARVVTSVLGTNRPSVSMLAVTTSIEIKWLLKTKQPQPRQFRRTLQCCGRRVTAHTHTHGPLEKLARELCQLHRVCGVWSAVRECFGHHRPGRQLEGL